MCLSSTSHRRDENCTFARVVECLVDLGEFNCTPFKIFVLLQCRRSKEQWRGRGSGDQPSMWVCMFYKRMGQLRQRNWPKKKHRDMKRHHFRGLSANRTSRSVIRTISSHDQVSSLRLVITNFVRVQYTIGACQHFRWLIAFHHVLGSTTSANASLKITQWWRLIYCNIQYLFSVAVTGILIPRPSTP